MKRIFLFLAAIATLASCLKENPYEVVDGNVTIKAVASDTKTLLDGTDVVWENEDVIKVIVVADGRYAYDFAVAGQVNGKAANFTGTIEEEGYTEAYAVYPASAVNFNNTNWLSHTLPETQTGVVTSGMNLSSAALDVEELQSGIATATFKNALTLLQVTVPAGVSQVDLTSSMQDGGLAGTASFAMDADGRLEISSRQTQRRTVTLSTGSELEEGTYSLLVYPGNYSSLTLKMTGIDGAVYESTISATFAAGEYRPINLTQIFKMETSEEMFISPAGGECEVKIASVADYTYNVSVANGDWLSYNLPTKGFHQDVITFSAGENTSGADRSADVTITWGEDQTRTFKMTQNTYEPALINDYLESYVYGNTYTGNLSVELSDDFSKGTYKVSGFLNYSTSYSGPFSYAFYANYANNVLTLIAPAASNGYFGAISSDVELNVSDDFKKMTMANRTFGYASVTNYQAVVALGAPELNAKEEAVVGVYDEVYTSKNTYSDPAENSLEGSMIISASDEASYGRLKVTFLGYKYQSWDGIVTIQNISAYADLSDDGAALTIYASGAQHPNYGPIDADVVLTVSDGVLSCSEIKAGSGYWTISGYTSTKQVIGGDSGSAAGVEGIYDATWNCLGGSFSSSTSYGKITEVVTINKKGDSENEYSVTNMFTAPNMGVSSTNYDATYENGTLTVHLDTGDIELSVSGDKLIYSNDEDEGYPQVHIWNFYTNSYEAVRRGN